MSGAARALSDAVGRGLFAGLVGTAAMTVSSTLEAKMNNRGASAAPADAASKVAGVEPTEEGEARFNNLVHWSYGTGWGAVRGVIGLLGLPGPAATLAHLGAVWGGEQAILPALGVASPTWEYGASAAATDVLHHVVYAVGTGLTYEWLNRT